MHTRSLGAEGPEVSVVGLGTNNFGARIDYEESKAVLDETIEQASRSSTPPTSTRRARARSS